MEMELNRRHAARTGPRLQAHWQAVPIKVRLPSPRWHNQLDPSIDKGKDWSEREIKTLFELQDQLGNKWASISREMDGRTDNNIKNFFYSSLRRAIRQVNQYVAQYKKKSNIKPFKQTILTKILNIND